MFFTFSQNNSGGAFEGFQFVIIEADSANEANNLAESHDIYFDGVSKGMDCSCCGDRWARKWFDDEGKEMPEIYGEPPEVSAVDPDNWYPVTYAIYYKDGRVDTKK